MTHHHHHHSNTTNLKRLFLVFSITLVYMFAEFIGGYFTNSLALIADSGHMLSDVISLGLSFFAIWLTTKKAPSEKSFGYYRAEIISAFLNGLGLIIISGVIMYEAHQRITNVQTVYAPTMLIIAIGGLLVNIIGAHILHQGSKENLNVKGAFLHIIADLMGSIGAIIAAILIFFFHWYIADPIISFIIAILILFSSFNIIKSAFDILMESVPENINIKSVQKTLEEIPEITNVHDLHIWCVNSNVISLSVHLVTPTKNFEEILSKAICTIKETYGIEHSTIQIEPENFHEKSCSIQHFE